MLLIQMPNSSRVTLQTHPSQRLTQYVGIWGPIKFTHNVNHHKNEDRLSLTPATFVPLPCPLLQVAQEVLCWPVGAGEAGA
jgi:hypothetical protein